MGAARRAGDRSGGQLHTRSRAGDSPTGVRAAGRGAAEPAARGERTRRAAGLADCSRTRPSGSRCTWRTTATSTTDPRRRGAQPPSQRMATAATRAAAIGENIADGFTPPSAIVAAWMGSDGHRANILGAELHRDGRRRRGSRSGTEYWTVDFGGYTDPGSVAAARTPTPPPRRHLRSRSRPRHRPVVPPRRRLRARPRHRRPRRAAAATTSGGSTGGGGSSAKGASAQVGSVVAPVTLASHLVAEPDRVKAHPGRLKILHPLRNDDNPESAPLRIVRVLHQPHGSRSAWCTADARSGLRLPHRAHGTKRLVYLVTTACGRGGPGRGHDRHRSEPRPQGARRLSPCGR